MVAIHSFCVPLVSCALIVPPYSMFSCNTLVRSSCYAYDLSPYKWFLFGQAFFATQLSSKGTQL
jgi:hypothetical protein